MTAECDQHGLERTWAGRAKVVWKGDCLMRQLHIREPWASLAAGSEHELLVELLGRIQVLENRMRTLEELLDERQPEPVGVS